MRPNSSLKRDCHRQGTWRAGRCDPSSVQRVQAPFQLRPIGSNVSLRELLHMRIVAWNCCRGPLQRKLSALSTLATDIAVLSEAPPPELPRHRDGWRWRRYSLREAVVLSIGRGQVQSALSAA